MADGMGLNNGKRIAPLVSAPTEQQFGDNSILKAIQDVSSKISIPSTPFTRDVGSAISTLGDVGLKAGAVAGVLGATGQGLARDAVQYFTGMEGLDLRPAAYEAANQVLFGEGLGGRKADGGIKQQAVQPTSGSEAARVPAPVTSPEPPSPAAPLSAASATATEPSTNKWWTQDNWRISGMGGVTPQGEMPTAVRVTKGAGLNKSDLLEARGVPELMPQEDRLSKETYSAIDQMKKIGGIAATKNISDLLKNEYAMRTAGKAGGIEAAKLAWEVEKFSKENDIKNPLKFMELAAKIAPKKTSYDETGATTVEPDTNAGLKILQEMGYTLPKGIKPIEQAKETEITARERLGRLNITGKKADEYIKKYKDAGVIQ